MSVYETGSVRVTVGSILVKGSNTDFSTYVNPGYLFRLVGEAVYYEVAEIVNATNLRLSGNYSNAGYGVGSPLYGRSYKITTSYTPNYSFPEMGPNDSGISYIFTKGMRDIDNAMYNASCNSIKVASNIDVTASNHGLVLTSPNGTKWRVTISNTGDLDIVDDW